MLRKIIDKFPTFEGFLTEYRQTFMDTKIDPISRAAHVLICRDVYYYYREREYTQNENALFGQVFSRINSEATSYAKTQQVFTNLIEPLKLKDKDLFVIEKKTEHSKENQKTTETPQSTDIINIPFVLIIESGFMISNQSFLSSQAKNIASTNYFNTV